MQHFGSEERISGRIGYNHKQPGHLPSRDAVAAEDFGAAVFSEFATATLTR